MDLRKFKEVESAALGCHLSEKKGKVGLPWCSVVKNPPSDAGDSRLHPWLGN